MVASQPDGRTETVSTKTDDRGHYTLTFTPDEPGVWTMQVVWNGDRSHASTQSRVCGVSVSEPPPAQPPPAQPPPAPTSIAVACHAGTADSPGDVSGSLTPGVSGAEIKLVYQRQGAPPT
jgi:hypothetical protein